MFKVVCFSKYAYGFLLLLEDGSYISLRGAGEYVGAVEKVRVKEAGVECFQCLGRECVFCSVNKEASPGEFRGEHGCVVVKV